MAKSLHLQLRGGELFYVNGAALRVDRRVSIEVMNDITFLLGSHILAAAEATTPLKQLYFALQLPLLEPEQRQNARPLILERFAAAEAAYDGDKFTSELSRVRSLYAKGRNFEALKALRALFALEKADTGCVLSEVSRH